MRAVAPSLHGKSTEAFAASSTSTVSLRCWGAHGCDVRSCQVLLLSMRYEGFCLDMLGHLSQLLPAKLQLGMALTSAIISTHLQCLASSTNGLYHGIQEARCETGTGFNSRVMRGELTKQLEVRMVRADGKGSRMEKDQGVLSDSLRCWLPRKQQ